MVALSHATAKELGYQIRAERTPQKPFVEVSGRKGLGVKIDDLLDLLIEKATREVGEAEPRILAPTTARARRRRLRSRRSATSC